uniref:Cell wall protein DAN4-like n=1 Tax=Phallusia mammillata TaxID=59560 RepID=A0A6F9DQ00_9ASCI|nr:cell wall protein DAN4-like [Phallusia mammillata]
MKSCYQAHACNINRDQNDHSCPRSCALCCYGDLCNEKGPDLCTCDILKLTTVPPPRTTTRFGYFPWLPRAPKPTKRVAKATVRDKQKRAEVGGNVNQTFADVTTQVDQTQKTTAAAPTTATTNTTTSIVPTTNSTTKPECEVFKAIPEYSPEIICNEAENEEELVECEGQPHTRALWESPTYFLANLSGHAWMRCRDFPENSTGSVEESNDRSLKLTCTETQLPNPQRQNTNRTRHNNATLEGTVTIYCTAGSYSIDMSESFECDDTFKVTCFMIFTSHSLPTIEPYQTGDFEDTHTGTLAMVTTDNVTTTLTSLATDEDAVAIEGNLATASGSLETWSIVVIALGCLLLVALSAVMLFRLITRRGIYHVNKVAPSDETKKEPEPENGKQDLELPG